MEAQRGAKYDDDDDDKEDEEEETVASVSELLKAGTLFLRLKLYSKASKCFALATQRSTDDDFRPWYNLGLSQSCAGEVDGARAAYLTALEKAPECPEAHLNLAALQMKVGELEEAEKHLRNALKTAKAEDTRKHAAWNYGSVLRQQGRHAEAVSFERERLLEIGGDTTLPKVEPEEQTRHQKVHVWCVKWGTKYDAEYVNKLFRGVSRHLDASIDFDFYCLTDDAEGVGRAKDERSVTKPAEEVLTRSTDAGVLLLPLNTERKGQEFTGWWGKLHLFSADLPVPRGSRMVYLDLDTVLCGDISQLAVLEAGGFCTLRTDGIINERRYACFACSGGH